MHTKKRDSLSEKRERGMALKSLSLRPKAVNLDNVTNEDDVNVAYNHFIEIFQASY